LRTHPSSVEAQKRSHFAANLAEKCTASCRNGTQLKHAFNDIAVEAQKRNFFVSSILRFKHLQLRTVSGVPSLPLPLKAAGRFSSRQNRALISHP
jgi:hypothetical protein